MLGGILAVTAVAGVGGALAWPRIRKRRESRRLHREFAEASALSAAESDWLWGLAQDPALSDPLLVFVMPSLLDAVADGDRARAEEVRQKLYS